VPLTPDNVRYPYMTADPFIFAALGLDSPFLFTRDEILSGMHEGAAGAGGSRRARDKGTPAVS
jgi:hypothetical protein